MDIIEIRDMLVKKHIILTYEECYDLNRDAFELVHNACLPCDLYQEYVDNEVMIHYNIEMKKLKGEW
jgi:hypothetical protein